MTYIDECGEFFGRLDENGNVIVLHVGTGEHATRLDASVYPVDSQTSARYEHPNGIIISRTDADKLGVEVEE